MQKITILFIMLVGITACHLPNRLKDMQSNIVSTTRNLAPFHAINVAGAADIKIHKAADSQVLIDAESGIAPSIITLVENEVLLISQEEGTSSKSAITIHVFMDELTQMTIEGAGSVEMLSEFSTPNLVIVHAGAGNVTLKGKARDFDCSLSGSGDMDASNLVCETVKVDLAGAGDLDICVKDKLNFRISGVGNIQYAGSPQITQDITGVGKAKQVNSNCN